MIIITLIPNKIHIKVTIVVVMCVFSTKGHNVTTDANKANARLMPGWTKPHLNN